jgi:hypothetical protein
MAVMIILLVYTDTTWGKKKKKKAVKLGPVAPLTLLKDRPIVPIYTQTTTILDGK